MLKNSIAFISTVIVAILIVFMSLGASKPYVQIESEDISTSISSDINVAAGGILQEQWPGLGMVLFHTEESYIDTLLANGFTQLRIDIPTYQNTSWLEHSKTVVAKAISKGAKVIWGVSSNDSGNSDYTITAASWPAYRQAILDAAEWAQNNGVYEFQLGNEEEYHIDGTTMTVDQLITNLKSVATDAQSIFTRGKISYTCSDNYVSEWISSGKGDIDILATNVYIGGGPGTFNNDWKTLITRLLSAFGSSGTYLTEFNLSWVSLESYSADESVQAAALSEMIEYIRSSGMTRALYFAWKDDGDAHFGVVKNDGDYRESWDKLSN